MGNARKDFLLLLVVILSISSLTIIESAFAQSIPEPSETTNVASISIRMSSHATVGTSFGWWAQLRDAQGNLVRNFTGTLKSTVTFDDKSIIVNLVEVTYSYIDRGNFWGKVTVDSEGYATIVTYDGYGHTATNQIYVTFPPTPTPLPTPKPSPTSTTNPSPSLTQTPTQKPELSPIILPLIVSAVLVTVILVTTGLLVYHKKHKLNSVKEILRISVKNCLLQGFYGLTSYRIWI